MSKRAFSPGSSADVAISPPGLIAQLKETECKLRKAAKELLEAADEVHEAHVALEELTNLGFTGAKNA